MLACRPSARVPPSSFPRIQDKMLPIGRIYNGFSELKFRFLVSRHRFLLHSPIGCGTLGRLGAIKMRVIGIVMISITLAGCFEATSRPPGMGEVFMSKEQLAAKDDVICRGYGAQPGSDVYIQCRVSQDQRRDAVRNAPSDPISPAPVAAGVAPMPNI